MIASTLLCLLLGFSQQSDFILEGPGDEPGLNRVSFVKWGERSRDGFLIGHYRLGRADGGSLAATGQLRAPEGGDRDHAIAAYDAQADRVGAATVERLAIGLGPAWRVADAISSRSVEVAGPADDRNSRMPVLAAASAAIGDEVRSQVRANALPPGPERDAALATAKAAGEKAEEALAQLRAETTVLMVRHAVGEDLAKALKAALPWGSFASVGGTQIVASGTRAELAAARELVDELDRAAQVEQAEARKLFEDRGRQSAAGRILSAPITIDFRGGLLPEYLKAIGAAAGAESWVIEDPRLASAFVPQIKLTGVTVDSAVRMLDGLTFPSADKAAPVNARFRVQRVDAAPNSEGVPPIYRIGAIFPGAEPDAKAPPPPPTLTNVFEVSLRHLHETDGGEESIAKAQASLLAAIETGIELSGPSDRFRVKLHAPTGLLFVSGTPSEIELVRTIIDQWTGQN